MSFISHLKGIEAKFAWSILGVFLAIVFGVFAIFPIFHEDKPNISVQITNEANVLDVHEPVKDLSVLFQGEDIQQNNLNLRILTVRVTNNGQVDILQNYYDEDDIWGLQLENGKIIESRLIDTNSDYIRENLLPYIIGEEDIIQFSKIIFEREKYFTLEILVLHAKDQMPKILAIGKIAGIDKVETVQASESKKEKGFFSRIIEGNVGVHIVRAIGYFILFIIAFILLGTIIVPIGSFIENLTEKSRKQKVNAFSVGKVFEKKSGTSKLLELFTRRGKKVLENISELIEDENELLSKIKKFKEEKKRIMVTVEKEIDAGVISPVELRHLKNETQPEDRLLGQLMKIGVISLGDKDELVIDKEFSGALKDLLEYLK
jgi:hypothetical protein